MTRYPLAPSFCFLFYSFSHSSYGSLIAPLCLSRSRLLLFHRQASVAQGVRQSGSSAGIKYSRWVGAARRSMLGLDRLSQCNPRARAHYAPAFCVRGSKSDSRDAANLPSSIFAGHPTRADHHLPSQRLHCPGLHGRPIPFSAPKRVALLVTQRQDVPYLSVHTPRPTVA